MTLEEFQQLKPADVIELSYLFHHLTEPSKLVTRTYLILSEAYTITEFGQQKWAINVLDLKRITKCFLKFPETVTVKKLC